MTARRTAYERTEPRKSAGPLLCIPTVMRGGPSSWRSWIEVVGRDDCPIQHGYLLDDDTALVIPTDMPGLMPRHFDGAIVPWERVPEGIRQHIEHVISGIEA